jgi:hypothetical protein
MTCEFRALLKRLNGWGGRVSSLGNEKPQVVLQEEAEEREW